MTRYLLVLVPKLPSRADGMQPLNWSQAAPSVRWVDAETEEGAISGVTLAGAKVYVAAAEDVSEYDVPQYPVPVKVESV